MVVFACTATVACASDAAEPDMMPTTNGAGGYAFVAGSGGATVPLPTTGGFSALGGAAGASFAAGGTLNSAGGVPFGSGGGGAGWQPTGTGGIAGAPPGGGGTIGTGGEPPNAGGSGSGGGPPGNCGLRAGKRGKSSRTVTVGSTPRTFVAYLPQSANPTTPVPFVYVFHGASQTGQALYDMTEYSKIADSEGIAVVFPDGQGASSATGAGSLTPWNVTDGPALCGLGTLVSNLNPVDFAFVDAIKADVVQDQCIDTSHVYATGFSMGGYFSHHVACDRPDFRGAGPHSGGTMADLSSCKTGHMPIIIFHGDADPLINEACSDPNGVEQAGFPAAATLWAKKNGCQTTYTKIPETGSNGLNGQCLLYDGCPADGQVEVCIMSGLAHAWSGAPVCAGCIGSGTGYPSATRIEWEFFKKYAW